MTPSRFALATAPVVLMIVAVIAMNGIEQWLSSRGNTAHARLILGRVGIALPFIAAAGIGVIFLFASAGSMRIKAAGWGVVGGSGAAIMVALLRELARLHGIARQIPQGQGSLHRRHAAARDND